MLQELQTALQNVQWVSIAALLIALALAAFLFVLWRKGVIKPDTITRIGDLLEGGLADTGTSFFNSLAYYAYKAVRAVEQLVKSGQLEKDNELRKNKAIEIVETYALADGYELEDEDLCAAAMLVEAEVAELPHTEK